ncbi:MAG: ferredoxin [Deltaproteobacteria bacterium]|nr:MAG: ferredoxin [Deltaproteobacteria bacterium]
MQSKKAFALVNYDKCDPGKCNPETGSCAAVKACSNKVIKQIDGAFEPPAVFQDMCMGCWDCVEACPLDAIEMKHMIGA